MYRDLVEMRAKRSLPIAHTTILRWLQRYAPKFHKRWSRFSCAYLVGATNGKEVRGVALTDTL
jgi:transposase-like protein